MTPENFTYWLQGYLEVSGAKEISQEQVQIIKDHLALVLEKKTPARTLGEQLTSPGTITVPAIGPYLGGKLEVTCSSIDNLGDSYKANSQSMTDHSTRKYCGKR